MEDIALLLPSIFSSKGVDTVILCSGSRNSFISEAFYRSNLFKCFPFVDERSAAFFALGCSLQTKKPVVIVTTSGTACANLLPAVIEAYYQKRILIIITADRPTEQINQAVGQTIIQNNLFDPYSCFSITLLETENLSSFRYNIRSVNNALNQALKSQVPAHINMPMGEPNFHEIKTLPPLQSSHCIQQHNSTNTDHNYIKKFLQLSAHHQKIMLVIGNLQPESELLKLIQTITEQKSIVIMAEPLSNIHNQNVYCPERFFLQELHKEAEKFQPQLLITFAINSVAKKLRKFLLSFPPQQHVHIDENGEHIDTFHCLTDVMCCNPLHFLLQLQKNDDYCVNKKYNLLFQQHQEKIDRHIVKCLNQDNYTDIKALQILCPRIPNNSVVHLANSTAVRYIQYLKVTSHVQYYCNRGTNGIDGCLSTAVGFATCDKRDNFLIIGDLAFLYDSNILFLQEIPSNLKVILINNEGGNIFSLIANKKNDDAFFRKFTVFEKKHDFQFLHKGFKGKYFYADTIAMLNETLTEFFSWNTTSAILEIHSSHTANKKLFQQIANKKFV